MLREANRADPKAAHLANTDGPFGWQVDACDVCVTDVSAVAYDWLATGKPLLLTRPSEPRAELPGVGLVTEMELLDEAGVLEHHFRHVRAGLQVAAPLELEEIPLGADDRPGLQPLQQTRPVAAPTTGHATSLKPAEPRTRSGR